MTWTRAGMRLLYPLPVGREARLRCHAHVVIVSALIVYRTAREDALLREELDGYKDYAKRVRYRLLPGVW